MKAGMDVPLTSTILQYLVEKGEFVHRRELARLVVGRNAKQRRDRLSAALWYLRKRKAADVLVQFDGEWWMATPESDDRQFIKKLTPVDFHHSKKRKARVKRVKETPNA